MEWISITALHRVKHHCSAPQLKVLSVMLGSDEHKANDPTSLLQPPLSRDVMISGFCWFKDLMFSLWHDYPQGFFLTSLDIFFKTAFSATSPGSPGGCQTPGLCSETAGPGTLHGHGFSALWGAQWCSQSVAILAQFSCLQPSLNIRLLWLKAVGKLAKVLSCALLSLNVAIYKAELRNYRILATIAEVAEAVICQRTTIRLQVALALRHNSQDFFWAALDHTPRCTRKSAP